jgi:hypothetical protein
LPFVAVQQPVAANGATPPLMLTVGQQERPVQMRVEFKVDGLPHKLRRAMANNAGIKQIKVGRPGCER